VKIRDVMRIVEADGWQLVATKGSHRQYKHPTKPGCIAVGDTREEIERNIQEAIEFHIAGLREDGLSIPEPRSASTIVEVAAA
jgi:predicted RNase H-like HicB family nuclease